MSMRGVLGEGGVYALLRTGVRDIRDRIWGVRELGTGVRLLRTMEYYKGIGLAEELSKSLKFLS